MCHPTFLGGRRKTFFNRIGNKNTKGNNIFFGQNEMLFQLFVENNVQESNFHNNKTQTYDQKEYQTPTQKISRSKTKTKGKCTIFT